MVSSIVLFGASAFMDGQNYSQLFAGLKYYVSFSLCGVLYFKVSIAGS